MCRSTCSFRFQLTLPKHQLVQLSTNNKPGVGQLPGTK